MTDANYPSNQVTFGADRQNLVSPVVADDVNSVYREVRAISEDLGAGNMGVGTPGLRYSSAWGVGSFDSTTTAWDGLQSRLKNIEKGLYQAYYSRLDLNGTTNFNTIQSVNAYNTGLIVKAGSLTGTVTYATSDGTTLTYTVNNSFSVGQKITVTGLTTTSGNPSLNFADKIITALVGTGPNYTGFSIASPTVGPSGVTGSTSGSSTSLTIVGDISAVIPSMTVSGTNIVSGTKVVSVAGQVVTLDTASSGTVSGGITFRTIGSTSGSQSGTVVVYQTTSLQSWVKGSTVVASMSPDGNLTANGTATIGGAASVGGALTVTGNASVGGTLSVVGDVTMSGSLTLSGAISAKSIDGGTP